MDIDSKIEAVENAIVEQKDQLSELGSLILKLEAEIQASCINIPHYQSLFDENLATLEQLSKLKQELIETKSNLAEITYSEVVPDSAEDHGSDECDIDTTIH